MPPPHDLEAERSLLGAALLRGDAIDRAGPLDAGDFYAGGYGNAWDAACTVHAQGEPTDPVAVAAVMRAAGTLDSIGGFAELVALQAAHATGNPEGMADIVRDRAILRRISAEAWAVHRTAGIGADPGPALERLDAARGAAVDGSSQSSRLMRGGAFLLDAPELPPAVWGQGAQVLWAEGEPLLLVGPAGVGKTTLAGQIVAGRLGIRVEVLGYPIRPGAGRLLYLACDRPAQIRRSLRRVVTGEHRDILEARLIAWMGPPPQDLARHPEALLGMARRAGADTVVLDSLKDVAIGLSDDEVGAGVNRAVQLCVAEGVEVLALHHQRKGQGGTKPRTLEDVYGSTWITAGAGSVILLWGAAGDPVVELVHLKQPAEEVGPLRIEHDHHAGSSLVTRGFNPLRFLQLQRRPVTATDVARAWFEREKPTDAERSKASRSLDRLVREGLAVRLSDATRGGLGGTQPARYGAAERPNQTTEV